MGQFKPANEKICVREYVYSQDQFILQTKYTNGTVEETDIPLIALVNSAVLGELGSPYGVFRSPITREESVAIRQAIIPIKYSLNSYKCGHLVVRYYTYDYSTSIPTEHIEELHYVVPDGPRIFFPN